MNPIIPKEAAGAARTWSAPDLGEPRADALGAGMRVDAPDVKLPTAQEIEAMFEQARSQGFEEGRRQGLLDGQSSGLQQGRAQAGAEIEALRALLGRLHDPVAHLDEELEQAVVTLALELARQVVVHELRTQPEVIRDVLQRALAAFPARVGTPWVRLHPDDVRLLHELAPELEQGGPALVADDTLQRGDVIVASGGDAQRATPERRWRTRGGHDGQSELDLRIEERWRQAMSRLFEDGTL